MTFDGNMENYGHRKTIPNDSSNTEVYSEGIVETGVHLKKGTSYNFPGIKQLSLQNNMSISFWIKPL